MPPGLRNRLIRLAAFQNPEFYKAQAMRLPIYDKPRIIACAEDHPKHIGLPRGCLDELLQTLADLNIKSVVSDQRNPHVVSAEAVLAVREWAYAERGIERLVSLIAPANVRSQRLAERLGATPGETVELFDGGPHVAWEHPR